VKYLEKRINKKFAFISLILLVVLFAFYGIYLRNNRILEEKKQYETSFTSEKRYGTLKITNIQKTKNHLIANILNTTDITFMGEMVDVVFLSNKGDVLCRNSYDIPPLEAHKEVSLNMVIEQKCKNAYTFVLEKKKEDKNGQ